MNGEPMRENKLPKECQETQDRLTDLDEGALRLGDALRVQLHLLTCQDCRVVRDELRLLPELVKPYSMTEQVSLMPMAQESLKAVLGKLPHREQVFQRKPIQSEVPAEVQVLLDKGADLTLQIMAMVHKAFLDGTAPLHAPYLPAPVLAILPEQTQWKWDDFLGAQVVPLLGEGDGPKLMLMKAPRGFMRPEHRHIGTEQMLVLEGLLEDGDKAYATGQWVHFGHGSVHEPHVLNEECWCLIREEGQSKYTGPMGWWRNLKSA